MRIRSNPETAHIGQSNCSRALDPLRSPGSARGKGRIRPKPTPRLEPSASRISNRQTPELEMDLSYRKQRAEIFLIAKFRPILAIERASKDYLQPVPFISNRHIPLLESGLSYRKQRT